MWYRRFRVVTMLSFASGFAVILFVLHNGRDNYSHTPVIKNNLMNIQQKVLKKELIRPSDSLRYRGNPEIKSQRGYGNESDMSSSEFSSSEFSEVEEEPPKERVSHTTGDNAGEVRVSSSTVNKHPDSETNAAASSYMNEHKQKVTLAVNHNILSFNRTAQYAKLTARETLAEDSPRRSKKRYKKFNYIWDEYDPNGWQDLPLLPTQELAKAQEGLPVVYNRVGKCGSRSVINVMRELARRNHFNFVSSLVYNKTRVTPSQEKLIVDTLSRIQRPYIFQRHIRYVDFTRYGVEQPKYINIIRDPLARMVSQYYFTRFGDGRSDRDYKGKDKYQTFDQCVLRGKMECLGTKSFYIIPFFCGQEEGCKEPTSWAFQEAVRNLKKDYVAVGILEELEDTFQVFEKALPELFDGAVEIYRQTVDGELRANISSMFTKHKVKPSPEVTQIMKNHMKLEYMFYELVKERFHAQKESFGVLKDHRRESNT